MATQGTNNNISWLRPLIIIIGIIAIILIILSFGLGFGFKFYNSWLQYGQPKTVVAQEKVVTETKGATEAVTVDETTKATEAVTVDETTKAEEALVLVSDGEFLVPHYSLGAQPKSDKDDGIRNNGEIFTDVTWEEIVAITGSDADVYLSKDNVNKKIYSVKGGTDIGTINILVAEETPDNQSSVYYLNKLWEGSNNEMGWLLNRTPTETDILTCLYYRFEAMFFEPNNGEHGTGCIEVTGKVAKGENVLFSIKLTKEEFKKITLDEFIQKFGQ